MKNFKIYLLLAILTICAQYIFAGQGSSSSSGRFPGVKQRMTVVEIVEKYSNRYQNVDLGDVIKAKAKAISALSWDRYKSDYVTLYFGALEKDPTTYIFLGTKHDVAIDTLSLMVSNSKSNTEQEKKSGKEEESENEEEVEVDEKL